MIFTEKFKKEDPANICGMRARVHQVLLAYVYTVSANVLACNPPNTNGWLLLNVTIANRLLATGIDGNVFHVSLAGVYSSHVHRSM